ncbi:MAG: arylsulfatase [Gammaproteobacteria bacterium]|nr:arylsulfatase [Gammaproteobacteria bacterium]
MFSKKMLGIVGGFVVIVLFASIIYIFASHPNKSNSDSPSVPPQQVMQSSSNENNNPTDGSVLPYPPAAFRGHVELSAKDSTPDFPKAIKAPAGAPNILIILLDDVGFGATSTFGGPIDTPTLNWLAKNGLRYNRFHTTALCSPTRAALLTGDNHHSAHTGTIMETGTGFPGYDTLMGKDTATVAQILRYNGWNTAWFGKNHNVPDWESSQAGPFDHWPTSLGFDYFYGFIGGDTNQWRPALYEGTKPIEPYLGNPNYNLDYDLADQAIHYIEMQKAVAPDKPFFVYYAPGATHAPHQPRSEWISKYKGKFDQGWDKVREETFAQQKKLGIIPADTELTPRQKDIPAWDSLTPDQKRLYAHMMEVYAGFLEQTDYNVGRIIEALKKLNQLDNTIIIYMVGDNGASAEGSLQGLLNEMTFFNGIPEDYNNVLAHMNEIGSWKTYNHYPVGWAWAMVSPFQWEKQIASHFGGTRNGLVIYWPKKIKDQGGIRSQFAHVIDITPTILDVTGVKAPYMVDGVAQKPMEGMSLAYTFNHPKAPSVHRTQYFEMIGNRAIYNDGWVAATTPTCAPWIPTCPEVDPITGYNWELYNTNNDFSEAKDLATQYPDKLKALQLLFYAQAAKYNVLPIDNSKVARLDPASRPSLTRGINSFTYYDGMIRIPEGAAPDIKNKSFSITADVEIPDKGAQGIIITQGGLFAGWALYLQNDKPVFYYNLADVKHFEIASKENMTAGKHTIVFNFKYDGGGIGKGGTGTLLVDGKQVAQGRIEQTLPIRMSLDEGLDVGLDTGTPVNLSYDVPFKFTGKIDKVVVKIEPVSKEDAKAVDDATKKSQAIDTINQ